MTLSDFLEFVIYFSITIEKFLAVFLNNIDVNKNAMANENY